MKQKLLWIIFALVTASQGATLEAGARFAPELKPEQSEAQAAHLAAQLLSRYHYKAVPLDDAMSEKIFDQYLKSLDPEKLFFVQADIDKLSVDRDKLSAAMLKEDLAVPFAIFNVYEQRVAERFADARALLKEGFNFTKDESFQISRKKAPWPQTDAEMHDLWRKRVKNDWLRLKLAGRDDKSIREILDKRYDHFLKRVGQFKSDDAFQTYMNAYTMAIEPHTNYMGPRAAEDFDISMKLSLVGIGATLAELDDYTTIRDLVPGGPASLSGQLQVGDCIVGVAQGESGVMTDVLGWRVDDVVALIRGAAGSVVRLDLLPADAGPDDKHKLVSLVRKTINLQEQAAKSSLQLIEEGGITHRIGVITLSSFYEDALARQKGIKDYKRVSRDVAALLVELKKQNVDAILVDLRNNGGGSLFEAVELTGLFVGKGPVVQERNAAGDISVERDQQTGLAWDGPLGVLINKNSASASEIFAAAIQDYGRGLIMGEPSFGKGTVQAIVDLDQIAKNSKPQFGELRMTIAQFFRINGGTTQLRGVKPDIVLPTTTETGAFGESRFDNALPWFQIKAVDYSKLSNIESMLPILSTLHENRVQNEPDYQYLQQDISEFEAQRKKNSISLNEAVRRRERDAQEAKAASRESGSEVSKGAAPVRTKEKLDDGLQVDERNLARELANEKAQKDTKDVVLIEAASILGDEVRLLQSKVKFSAQVNPADHVMPKISPDR